MRIDIWSDVVCPWCFIGKRRLESALAGFEHADEVEIVYRSFELDPSAPRGGHQPTVEALTAKYGPGAPQMMQQVAQVAAEEGLAFRLEETVHTNTVDAHRVLHLALAEGGPALQARLKEGYLSAYFEQARNIGDPAVLREVAVATGLDPARVDEVLAGAEFSDAVAADIAQARQLGASGVPFFVVDQRYAISGAQPVEVFERALQQAWQDAHPTLTTLDVAEGDDVVCGPDGCAVPEPH